MKLVLGFIFLILSTVLGGQITSKYKKRVDYFEEFIRFNHSLRRNLNFKRENTVNLLDFNTENQEFLSTLQSAKISITGVSEEKIYVPDFIEEPDFFTDYFNNIGAECVASELDFLTESESVANEKLLKIKDNCSKFSKLGNKLGFSVGMVVMILIL